MIFEDPIRTLRVDLPTGWTCNPFDSTLTDFVFMRWDQPEDLIAIHLRRAVIPEDQPDERWIEKIRSEIGIGAAGSLIDMVSNQGRAVAAEFKSDRGLAQRVAFVRGPKVELVLEHRSTAPATPDRWAPLEMVVRTASSDANLEIHEDSGPEEFNKSVVAANLAFEKNDSSAIKDALQQTIKIGISAWLQSMAAPGGALEIDASVRVAQAVLHLGYVTGGPFLLREADFVLRRAQHSLEAAGLSADWAQKLEVQILETLQSVWSELLRQDEANDDPKMLPILSLRERGFRLTQTAAKAFEAQDSESAYSLAGAAVEDLLSLIAFLRRNPIKEIPEDIAEHLCEQGITDQESQRDAIQKAREAHLFPALNMASQIRYCCALERKDPEGASEAVSVQATAARLIFDENSKDAAAALNLALTMMDCAASAALLNDNGKLEDSVRCLEDAVRILDSIGDRRCSENVWIRYYRRQIDDSLQAIDSSRQRAKRQGATVLETNLSGLYSQFQNVAARFQETAVKAAFAANQTS